MYPHRAAAATALLALYCVLAENEKVVVERNSFLTPKSNNELFKSAKTVLSVPERSEGTEVMKIAIRSDKCFGVAGMREKCFVVAGVAH